MIKNQYLKKKYLAKKRKKFYKRRIFWFSVLLVLLISSLFYFLAFSPVFQIREVKIIGADKSLTSLLSTFIKSLLARKILFFSTKSIVFLNSNNLAGAAYQSFPQIYKIRIKKELPAKIVVEVKKREPIAIFCLPKNNCFFMDKEGVAFQRAKQINMLVVKDKSKKSVQLGQQIVAKSDIKLISQITLRLEEIHIKPKIVNIFPLYLLVEANKGCKIYFSKTASIDWQVQELRAVLAKEVKTLDELDYIDLRFDKVFYKLK